MEKLLFESSGSPRKRSKLLRICGVTLLVCGLALVMLGAAAPSYVSGKGMIMFLGVVAIGFGAFFCAMPNFDFTNKVYLRLYENHVEGRQAAPDREFRLDYTQIYNVRKNKLMGNDFLVIETVNESYAVLVNELDLAYSFIDQKLAELEKIEGGTEYGFN